MECSQLDTRNLYRTWGNVFEDLLAPNEPTAACLGNGRNVTDAHCELVSLNTRRLAAKEEEVERNILPRSFQLGIYLLVQKELVRKNCMSAEVCEIHFRKHPNLSTFLCWKRLSKLIFFVLLYIATIFRILKQGGTMFYFLPAKFQITVKVGMRCEEESLINSVLAMFEQETNQNLLMPRDQKLDTMVKTHVDQMITT